MFGVVFKTIGTLILVFVFFSLVVVKNAVNEEGEDQDESREGNQVYPPHMWKGLAIWIGVIYGIINLITLAIAF